MTDLQRPESPSRSVSMNLDEFLDGYSRLRSGIDGWLRAMAIRIGQGLDVFCQEAERQHHRAELLEAYKRRTSWKKSDIQSLNSLGVSRAALRRMERLSGTGRPVVRPHQPLDVAIVTKVNALLSLKCLVDPDTSPDKRRRAFKLWPWWRHYVEALYRGEHALAKEKGIRSASTEAEMSVGRALGISSATVHSICGEIRSMRRDDQGSANFQAMTLAEYESWMETGKGRWTD